MLCDRIINEISVQGTEAQESGGGTYVTDLPSWI